MSELNENSTNDDIENFLYFHMDKADSSKSKINPYLTKEQVWNINMGTALRGDDNIRVRPIMIKNIIREFGSHYEV